MRKLTAILAFALCLAGTNLGVIRANASPSSDLAGSVPTATSFIYPVGAGTIQPTWTPGNSNGYFITQGFNTSCDPSLGQGYYLYGLYYCGHTGVDLASTDASAIVHATAAGIVVSAGYNGGYGVMVRIKHVLPDGSLVYSQYEHMAYGSLAVYSGEIVSQGQQLGLVGATGFATGAHLHFEIKTVDEDGWGYTFGNNSLIAGYLEPLAFVAAHQLQPANVIISRTGHAIQTWPAESEYILRKFLKSYKHFVVVGVSDGLRVRSGPSLHARVLGVALRGAKLGYLQTQGQWIRIALPQHVTGWVNLHYVKGYQDWSRPSQPHTTIWPTSGPVAVVASTLGLNVHAAPGQSHPVVSAVFQGDRLSVLSRTTNWDRVLTRDGTRGWVLRRYVLEPGKRAAPTASYITASATVLNVRSGPGLQYTVTGSVFRGTKMQLVRNTPHWAAVILPGGTTGWVARPLTTDTLAVSTGARTATRKVTTTTARAIFLRVATPVLNIRNGPGITHQVIAQVVRNTSLQVLALTPHWAHVALPASRIDGWVVRDLTR